MTFVVILIIVILIWSLFGQRISQWIRAQMMGKFEDSLRAQMGMPSRKEERRQRKQAEKEARRSGGFSSNERYSQTGGSPYQHRPDSIIPKEYAEDVEFVEYKDYSASAEVSSDGAGTRIKVEEQVEDAEFVEIKGK